MLSFIRTPGASDPAKNVFARESDEYKLVLKIFDTKLYLVSECMRRMSYVSVKYDQELSNLKLDQ